MPPAGGPGEPVSWGAILGFSVLLVAILLAGTLFYQSQEQQVADSVTTELTSIALLKVNQIAAWRGEQLSNAEVLSQNVILIDSVKEYLSSPDPVQEQKIRNLFGQINTSYHYHNVQLVDREGRVKISLDPADTAIGPELVQQLAESVATKNATLTDFSRDPVDQSPRMHSIAPLIVTDTGKTEVVGAVILTIDPAHDLCPLIKSWPVPRESAETLLVEREGDHVLYLNELRHEHNTALNLTIPLSRADLPAVQAVLGATGVFTGRDYRGIEVLSVLEPVPGSPWFMVAKIDTTEMFGPWRIQSGLIIILTTITLAGIVVIAGLVWQRQQKIYFKAQYEAEAARRETEMRSQEMLKASEARLRRFYDSGLFGVVYWNMDGAMTDANDTFLAMVGYTREDLERGLLDWSRMTPPEFAHLDRAAVEELRETGINRVPYEKEYFRKDGSRLPILLACAMLDARRFDGVAFILDITNLKKTRAALAVEQEQYNDLFNNVSIGILRSTPGPNGEIIAANPAAVRIFDAESIEELLATAPSELYASPEQRLKISEEIEMKGEIRSLDIRYRSLKGREFWGRITSKKKVSDDGSIFFDNSIEDVTEQKAAEAALQQSEEKYRTIFDNSILGIYQTTPEGTYNSVNPAFAAMYGYDSPEEMIAAITDIQNQLYIRPEDQVTIKNLLATDGFVRDFEAEFRHCDGHHIWIRINAQAVRNSNGVIQYYEGTTQDITERKRAEETLERNEALLKRTGEIARVGGWELDATTKTVLWTEKTYNIHEVPVGHVPPLEEAINFFHPDEREKLSDAIERAFTRGEGYDMELRFITAKGRHLWTRTVCKPEIVDGKVVRLIDQAKFASV